MGKIKFLCASLLAGLVLTLVIGMVEPAPLPVSHAHSSSTTPLKITAVKVTNATTVHVTFNNPLKEEQDAFKVNGGQNNHFFGEHLGDSTPHIHAVSNIELSSDKKTVTLTLKRALHKDEEIDLAVLGVVDDTGNTLSSTDWEVWDTGSKN